MPGHKAMGLLAQLEFERWLRENRLEDKYYTGCWVVAKKSPEFYRDRTCFFIAPEVASSSHEVEDAVEKAENRSWKALFGSLVPAGFQVVFCVAEAGADSGELVWRTYRYVGERLTETDTCTYFGQWRGMGRPSRPKPWPEGLVERYSALGDAELTRLVLPQLFYNAFFKGRVRVGQLTLDSAHNLHTHPDAIGHGGNPNSPYLTDTYRYIKKII